MSLISDLVAKDAADANGAALGVYLLFVISCSCSRALARLAVWSCAEPVVTQSVFVVPVLLVSN